MKPIIDFRRYKDTHLGFFKFFPILNEDILQTISHCEQQIRLQKNVLNKTVSEIFFNYCFSSKNALFQKLENSFKNIKR